MTQSIAAKAVKLQGALEKVINCLIANDFEMGVQAAIYLDGEQVVDICAGKVSPDSDRKVQPDTIFPVCSTGKGVLATVVHVLAEQGVIDYDKKIAEYWPEFGCNGKEDITVRIAMAHLAAMTATPAVSSLEELCDFDFIIKEYAKMAPQWEPGTRMQYHSRTWGWLVGGIIAKATGKSVPQLLKEHVTAPLGIDREMFFGIDDEADQRYSAFIPQPSLGDQCSTAAITNAPPPPGSIKELQLPIGAQVNLPEVKRACIPAINGIMSARAIARMYAAAVGSVDGLRLFPESRLDMATELVTELGTTPECFGHGFGLGYALKGPANDMSAFIGHGGAGGSEGMVNRRMKLAFGLVKNRLDRHADAPDHTVRLVIREMKKIMGDDLEGGFYE